MAKTVFITGTSRGIGLEFVRQYLNDGWRVIATCRSPEKAEDLQKLRAHHPSTLRIESLEVSNWIEIARLKDWLNNERIDLLINNAGTYGQGTQRLGEIDVSEWERVLVTNCIAPIKVVEELLPLLEPGAVIASLTSQMGSIADNSSGGHYYYRSSKAALNAANRSLALDLAGRHIAIVFHPGWVQTDMGGPGALITPAQSVAGMRKVIAGLTPEDSGRFFKYDGSELPW